MGLMYRNPHFFHQTEIFQNSLRDFFPHHFNEFARFAFHDFLDHIISVMLVLLAGAFFASPVFKMIYDRIKNTVFGLILHFVLFWASVAALVDAAYNPFLYFRF